MTERSPILSVGRIVREHRPDHLYEVEMPNGYRAYAIRERKGPLASESGIPSAVGAGARVEFSPFDMSRCKIVAWLPAS